MAFAVQHHFPGGTQAQYEATLTAVHGSMDVLPEGQLFHLAGAVPGGWEIFAVHDNKASWVKFRDEVLMPRFQAGIEGGFTTPPDETEIEVSRLIQSPQLAKVSA
ncbi:MAG: hypothetical protein JWL73_1471 [Actinomycetia bacterium]|nr:hypothetical protein [Actinomycetes bacterium]